MPTDADRVRALYEARPYPPPDAGPGRPFTLSVAWLDAVRHPHGSVTEPGRRVLVAGCGRGSEAHAFASALPRAEVVGVDFSAAAIAGADAGGARLVHGDLTDPALPGALGAFDLIVCSGVAGYVRLSHRDHA